MVDYIIYSQLRYSSNIVLTNYYMPYTWYERRDFCPYRFNLAIICMYSKTPDERPLSDLRPPHYVPTDLL